MIGCRSADGTRRTAAGPERHARGGTIGDQPTGSLGPIDPAAHMASADWPRLETGDRCQLLRSRSYRDILRRWQGVGARKGYACSFVDGLRCNRRMDPRRLVYPASRAVGAGATRIASRAARGERPVRALNTRRKSLTLQN